LQWAIQSKSRGLPPSGVLLRAVTFLIQAKHTVKIIDMKSDNQSPPYFTNTYCFCCMGVDELRIMNYTWRDNHKCRGDMMDTAQYSTIQHNTAQYSTIQHNTAQYPLKNRFKIFYLKQQPVHRDHAEDEISERLRN
jgi:hypothetical protein